MHVNVRGALVFTEGLAWQKAELRDGLALGILTSVLPRGCQESGPLQSKEELEVVFSCFQENRVGLCSNADNLTGSGQVGSGWESCEKILIPSFYSLSIQKESQNLTF